MFVLKNVHQENHIYIDMKIVIYIYIYLFIYLCLDMSQNEVSDFGSKMATLRGNVDTLF